jgi:hypothetical protein
MKVVDLDEIYILDYATCFFVYVPLLRKLLKLN